MSHYTLGIDTSNYATSLAVFDTAGEVVCAKKRFLPVKEGQLGLRQSDALFHHTVALPEMMQELAQEFDLTKIDAVGVSQKPRPVEGSYMPCFLAGVSAATAFAQAKGIPLVLTTHQQGHAAAALFAAKGEQLFTQKVLLFHISGGTTDLLLCDQVRQITTLGTSTDLYAGQAVDRVGVKLGFGFPAGAEVSRLAALCTEEIKPKSSVKGMQCSLSGLENQCNALLAAGKTPEYVCKYCLLCVADTVVKMTKAAQKEYPGLPVVCAGGVMSSDIIHAWVQKRLPQVYFVPGQYSSDNAIGVSILAARGGWFMAEVITVSALNRYVKTLLDANDVLFDLALRGEIANFVQNARSGHCYFTLRDEASSVKAVMFRTDARRLAFRPEEGMRVVVRCRATLYERDGAFQVYVNDMFPDGVGAAQLALEQLKAKLEKEGLFDAEHKKPLPAFPKCIGVVTSKTGAALQDIRNVITRRWPSVRLLLCPVTVQGFEAAQQVAAAIRTLDQHKEVDEIIVARGGGGREDLWVFNAEIIARAAYRCKKPLISAIGHEIDYTILDFVADRRAPTPSAAAELAVPDRTEQMRILLDLQQNIRKNMQKRFDLCYNGLEQYNFVLEQGPARRNWQEKSGALQQLQQSIRHGMRQKLQSAQLELQHTAALTGSLNPYKVLARGYAMVTAPDGTILNTASLQPEKTIYVRGAFSRAKCRVEAVEEIDENTQSFEEGMERLNTILAQMQSEETTLADSVKLYAEAASLMEYCHAALEKTSLQIDEIDAKLAGTLQEEKRMEYKEQYQQYLARAQAALEKACGQFLPEESEVCRAARYSLLGGGKRIRAVLVLSVCDMLNGDLQAAEQFAAAVEMLHCYSLIHDDLPCMDNDDLRRGRPSCHKAFDEATAMLAGDVLLTEAFETVANAPAAPSVCVRAARALGAGAGSRGMVYGQELDLKYEALAATEEQLRLIHRNKTGALINAAIQMGAAAANASEEQSRALEQYAYGIGLVFQIVDDVLDVTSTPEQLGKPIGSDSENGKTTFVTLYGTEGAMQLAQQLNESTCAALRRSFGGKAEFLEQLAQQLLVRKN